MNLIYELFENRVVETDFCIFSADFIKPISYSRRAEKKGLNGEVGRLSRRTYERNNWEGGRVLTRFYYIMRYILVPNVRDSLCTKCMDSVIFFLFHFVTNKIFKDNIDTTSMESLRVRYGGQSHAQFARFDLDEKTSNVSEKPVPLYIYKIYTCIHVCAKMKTNKKKICMYTCIRKDIYYIFFVNIVCNVSFLRCL